MGAASLVMGIISVVGFFIPGVGSLIGLITGIIGIILGAQGRKDPEKAGIATGGMVISIVGTVLCAIGFIACGGCALLGCTASLL